MPPIWTLGCSRCDCPTANRVEIRFSREHESVVAMALRDHSRQKLRVRATQVIESRGGRIRSDYSAEEVTLVDPSAARPIWEVALELGARIPEEELELMPTDLARNLDHYLYGAPKVGKEAVDSEDESPRQ